MATSYTLTLPTDQSERSRNQVVEVRSFARDCGHRHREVDRAALCSVDGQEWSYPRMQVIARDGKSAAPRRLNAVERETLRRKAYRSHIVEES